MKRYLDDGIFNKFKEDFVFLFKTIKDSDGELDLRLRDNSFNLYYKGNSLAYIEIKSKGDYRIKIHEKFVTDVFEKDNRFNQKSKKHKDYIEFLIAPKLLHPFFQKKYLKKLTENIKKVNNGEEITFEQILITDNIDREDFFIIDKQVQVIETSLKGRLDLLALRQQNGNKYCFEVLEVKLGNNPELKEAVGKQLEGYIGHIKKNFNEWKKCYEKNYEQIKKTGIFNKPSYDTIEIIDKTNGKVIVGGYSIIGSKSIKELKKHFLSISVKQFLNKV